jgi:hypothetical protein
MFAYLWTPADLVQLDLAPMLLTEERRLARQDDRLCEGRAWGIPSQARRTSELVQRLRLIVQAASVLPAYDAASATRWIGELAQEADGLRRRWPAWVYLRVAEHAAHRLLPYPIRPGVDAPLPSGIAQRLAALRRRGELVVVAPR